MSTELIKKLADNFIEAVGQTKLQLSYDENSIAKLDMIVENSGIGPESDPDEINRIVEVMGAFLGQAMSEVLGMEWRQREDGGQWVLDAKAKNGDNITANPFHKVYKRFMNGKEDSITYYYAMLKKALAGELPPQQ